MLTLGMTAGAEKDVIWVYKIDMDGSYLYFSTEWDKITLDGIDFDGKVMFKDSMGQMEEGIVGDGINGGNISIVSNHSFSIARYNDYTGTSNFFNDFYPQTSKPLLVAKDVHVGVCWRGATTLAEITWIKKYKVQEVKTFYNKMDIFCIEEDELSATQLPPYTTQDQLDDGISYYPDLEEELLGVIIPIIYGSLHTTNPGVDTSLLSPVIRVSRDNLYKVSSHICHTLVEEVYQYSPSVNGLITLTADTVTLTNDRSGATLGLVTSGANTMNGSARINPRPRDIIAATGVTDKNKAFDSDNDTYAILPTNTQIQIKISGISESTVGTNLATATDCQVKVRYKTATAGDSFRVTVAPNLDPGQETYMPGDTTVHDETFDIGLIPVDQLSQQTIYFVAPNTNSGNVYLYEVYLLLPNQLVYAIDYAIGTLSFKGKSTTQQWIYGGNPSMKEYDNHGVKLVKHILNADIDIKNSELFCTVKGYIYDNWID